MVSWISGGLWSNDGTTEIPFQREINCHHHAFYIGSSFYVEANEVVQFAISLLRKALPDLTTLAAWDREPIRDNKFCFLQALYPHHC